MYRDVRIQRDWEFATHPDNHMVNAMLEHQQKQLQQSQLWVQLLQNQRHAGQGGTRIWVWVGGGPRPPVQQREHGAHKQEDPNSQEETEGNV